MEQSLSDKYTSIQPICFSLTSDYDVALMRLSAPVNFTSQPLVRPICLPQVSQSESPSSYAGALATVTGWGTIYSSGPTSDVLQVDTQ